MQKLLLYDAKIFLTLIIISIILIVLDLWKILELPKTFLQFVTTPIQYGLYKTSLTVARQFEFVSLSRRAAQENLALQEQLANVLSENANLRRKLAEVEGFAEQEKSLDPQKFNLIPARPVGFSRYLLIDKGSIDNIKLGQIVVFKENYIGKIVEATPKQSKVQLVFDPDSQIAAFVSSSEGKAKGILKGQFGSEMLLEKILHQESVTAGDLVYTEGTEIDIPRGLILGQVEQVVSEDNQIFKQAKVKPVFDIGNLDIIFVISE